MPVNEKGHPLREEDPFRKVNKDKGGLRTRAQLMRLLSARWRGCWWRVWQDPLITSTEHQSVAFLWIQGSIKPCHLVLKYWQRAAGSHFNMDLTGMLLQELNHKNCFLLEGILGLTCWTKHKFQHFFHTLKLILKVYIFPQRGVVRYGVHWRNTSSLQGMCLQRKIGPVNPPRRG